MKWQHLTLRDSNDFAYEYDSAEVAQLPRANSNPSIRKVFAEGIRDWLLTGCICGLFFEPGFGDHEDREDPSTYGPVGPQVIDWNGFLEWAADYLDAEDIAACRRKIGKARPRH